MSWDGLVVLRCENGVQPPERIGGDLLVPHDRFGFSVVSAEGITEVIPTMARGKIGRVGNDLPV